ncbi:MAG: hypothetical protein QW051_00630 [Candidatus Aenigmatarchaeota archaeon]
MKKKADPKEQSTLLPEDVAQGIDAFINLLEYLKRKVNAKRYVVFKRYVPEFEVEGDLVGPFYPGELVRVPAEIADDLYAKGLVEKPKQTKHTYFIELIDKDGRYVLSIYTPKRINREVRSIYKEYAIQNKKESEKDDISTEFFVDFLRRYRLFREIYMNYHFAQKEIKYSAILSKSKKVGLSKNFVETLLSILEDKKIIIREKQGFRPLKPLEALPEAEF